MVNTDENIKIANNLQCPIKKAMRLGKTREFFVQYCIQIVSSPHMVTSN